MANSDNTVKMFDTILALPGINDASLQKARELFAEYKLKNIIRSGEFDDERWYFTDEYSNISMHFSVPEFEYMKYYEPILGIEKEIFENYLKIFVMFSMGDIVLDSIRDVLYDINKLLKLDPTEIDVASTEIFIHHPSKVIDFFSMIPEVADNEKMDHLYDVLDNLVDYRYSLNNADNKRPLASFDSYFLFNDIIKDYWSGNIPENERLFFYPLYLWWRISGVIPLRPREFILTPRNCLEKRDDGWYITLRRNQIKGSEKRISYKIKDDYYTVQYPINTELAEEIQKYIIFTNRYESTELETLFVTDVHYRQWNRAKHKNSRYFTYTNLNCVMRYFYHDVIEDRYGLKIVYDREIKHLK